MKLKNNDSVVAWIDGACVQDSERRAVESSSMLVMTGIALSLGREQTDNRAEHLAAIAAMRVQDGNLDIRSDSEYVVRTAAGLLQGENQVITEGNADLWDLWDEFVTGLRLKTTRQLDFVWVRGHATKSPHRQGGHHHSGQRGQGCCGPTGICRCGASRIPQALAEAERVALSTHMFIADLLFLMK